MKKEERIKNFKSWIDAGNELTVEDMLSVIVGCMDNDNNKEFNTFFMVGGCVYDISIKARRYLDA